MAHPVHTIRRGSLTVACLQTIVPQSPTGLPPEEILFGRTETMAAIRSLSRTLSQMSVPLLIHGEPGVGKETMARHIHRLSPWRDRVFLKFNPAEPDATGSLSRPAPMERVGKCWGTFFVEEVS